MFDTKILRHPVVIVSLLLAVIVVGWRGQANEAERIQKAQPLQSLIAADAKLAATCADTLDLTDPTSDLARRCLEATYATEARAKGTPEAEIQAEIKRANKAWEEYKTEQWIKWAKNLVGIGWHTEWVCRTIHDAKGESARGCRLESVPNDPS